MKERIRIEERYRHEIRHSLEASEAKRTLVLQTRQLDQRIRFGAAGAAMAAAASLLTERWNANRASRTAALMVVRELDFHKSRLALVMMVEQYPDGTYEMRFPSHVWSAHGTALLAGAPLRESESDSQTGMPDAILVTY